MNIAKIKRGNFNSSHAGHLLTLIESSTENDESFYEKAQFRHLLRVEQMRAERSKRPLLLMLLDISALMENSHDDTIPEKITSALCPSLREVDIRGWYNHKKTIGVIFTEISSINAHSIEVIIGKIYQRFCERLDPELIKKINVFFHIYPKM